jgi:DNA invertase Pin-like site-specific DNA recombinase
MIARRTKDALAAAKERGQKLGGWRGGPKVDTALGRAALREKADAFASVAPLVRELHERGLSLRQIAEELMARGIRTSRGEDTWTAMTVRRVLLRAPEKAA